MECQILFSKKNKTSLLSNNFPIAIKVSSSKQMLAVIESTQKQWLQIYCKNSKNWKGIK